MAKAAKNKTSTALTSKSAAAIALYPLRALMLLFLPKDGSSLRTAPPGSSPTAKSKGSNG